MASLDLLRRHLYPTVIALGLLVGGIVGLFFPIRAASPPKANSDTWALPTVTETKRYHEDAYASLRAARFWKTVAMPGQRNDPKVEWTLAAIITKPQPMAAISQAGAKQPSSLVAVGAQFPDGATLLRLTRDAVWFEKDGCVRERRLFRAVTAENNACLGETTPVTSGPAKPGSAKPGAAGSSAPAAISPTAPRFGADPAQPTPVAPRAAGAATP